MTMPTPANLYTQGFGSRAENVEVPAFRRRPPTIYDTNYPGGKRWIDTTTNGEWSLTSFNSVNGVLTAVWTLLSGSTIGAAVTGLTGDDAVEVLPGPDGVINVLGGVGITTLGDPIAHILFISANAAGMDWVNITASQEMNNGEGYICTGGGAIVLTLPAAATFGQGIIVILNGSTSVQIAQQSGQTIRVGNATTTTGTGGSLTSTFQGDALTLICSADNTNWVAQAVEGNWTIV